MELLDVIDEEGNVLGTKDRKEVYKDGDLHRTVHIWIINSKKELLVQKRSPKKDTYPNLWAISTAGHVKAGDTNIKTALREVKEELGIKAKVPDLEYLFSVRRKEEDSHAKINTIDDVYLLEADLDVEETKLQFTELTDIKYVYYEYLEQIFKNNDPDYVPNCEEHKLLFKYLHDKFDEHDSIGVLYKTEHEYSYSEHMKLHNLLYRRNILINIIAIMMTIIVICNAIIYGITSQLLPFNMALILAIVYLELLIYLPKYRFKKAYESNLIFKEAIYTYTFYEEYFNIKTKQMNLKVFYGQLYKIIETSDNYYLFTSNENYYVITKNNIDSSFNTFISNKVTCPYIVYGRGL